MAEFAGEPMKKRLFVGTLLLLGLILGIIFAYDLNLSNDESMRDPANLSSYPDRGYFKIDPETILTSLAQGNSEVFAPLPENLNSVQSSSNVSFSWTQSNFLEVASALVQRVWKDPMSMKDWSIYFILFQTDCRDNINGFDFAAITYFKLTTMEGRTVYVTRHIDVVPYDTVVRWGDGAWYPVPILQKWKSVNLAEARFTAEDALQIAEKHGGKEARLNAENNCLLQVDSPQNSDYKNWYLSYLIRPDFVNYAIDLDTGEYKILGRGQ